MLSDPARLAAVRESSIFPEQEEKAFDRLTKLATHLLQTPMALISVVEAERQFHKSATGLPEAWSREVPLSLSLCKHVVERGAELVVKEARVDPLVQNSLMVREHDIAAYLGVPLRSAGGVTLGAVCAMDTESREWTAEDMETLQMLSELATQELRLREAVRVSEHQGHVMRGVADALSLFLEDDLEAVAFDGFAALGLSTGVDRVYLFALDDDDDPDTGTMVVSQRYEWARDTVEAQIDNPVLQHLDLAAMGLGRWVEAFRAGRDIAGPVSTFPESERSLLADQDIESLLAIPIVLEGRLWGFMGFDDCRSARVWSDTERSTLALAAAGAGEAVVRSTARDALVVSEERYRYALANVQDVVFQIDLQGYWTFLSPAWTSITGLSTADTLGTPVIGYMCASDRPLVEESFEDLLAGRKKLCRREYRLIVEGDLRWIDVYATSQTDEDGDIACITGVLRDIHDRKQAERDLHASEERLRLAIAAAKIGTWNMDLRANTVTWSPELLALFGVTEPERQAQDAAPLYEIVYEPDRPLIEQANREAFEAAQRTGEAVEMGVEFRVALADGLHWFRSRGQVYTDGVQPTRASGAVVDITEERAARRALVAAKEEAEDLARLKTTFVNTMSHEVRTPLSAIIGFADLLAEEVEDEHRDMAKLIQDGAHRLLRTLNSVLDLARLESDAVQLRPDRIDLAEEVRGCVRLLASQAEAKNLTLCTDVPSGEVWAWADAGAVQRICLNLLSNAVKFTDEGRVRLSVEADGEHVFLVVQDSGIGMSPEFLARAFEPFRRAEGMASGRDGTGLGLAITHHLTRLMDGEVEVESEPGTGTTFRVRLPAAA